MKRLKLIGFLMIGWLMGNGFSPAQEASAPVTIHLTLQKVEELALLGNPHIHAADARAKAASRQSSQTLSPADPVFMIDKTGQTGDPLNFGTGTEMWMVEENLGFPGRSFAKADMDGAEAKRTKAMAQDTRRSILLQARQTFWDFYYRLKTDEILRGAQAEWKKINQSFQSRELTGQWLSLKAIRAQMETAKTANTLITASRGLKVSQQNLNHLLSQTHGTIYQLQEEPSLQPFSGEENDFVKKALSENPEIEVYRKAVERQEARRQLALLDHLPDFTVRVSGTRDPNGSGFSDYGFRLGVTIPLFFPFKQTQAMDQAGDELSAARYDLQGKQNEVVHMVEDAYVGVESAWRILKLYEEGGLLKQVQRAWTTSQSAYHNEEISLTDFSENLNTYVETVTNYYEARADYGKALAELDYEIGNLPVLASVEGGK